MRQRMPRMLDPGYLAFVRQQPCCCGCNQPPPCDAAHLRMGNMERGKPACTGMQRKPDDKFAVPLKHDHHMDQHATGDEELWWAQRGVDPFVVADKLYEEYGGDGGRPSRTRPIKPRKPRENRTKITGRSNWPKNRGFGK